MNSCLAYSLVRFTSRLPTGMCKMANKLIPAQKSYNQFSTKSWPTQDGKLLMETQSAKSGRHSFRKQRQCLYMEGWEGRSPLLCCWELVVFCQNSSYGKWRAGFLRFQVYTWREERRCLAVIHSFIHGLLRHNIYLKEEPAVVVQYKSIVCPSTPLVHLIDLSVLTPDGVGEGVGSLTNKRLKVFGMLLPLMHGLPKPIWT